MKRTTSIILIFAAVSFLIYSCSKYPGYKKHENGFYYKFISENTDSVKADTNFILTLQLKYTVKINGKDSVFFNSSEMAKPFQISLQKPQFKGDVFDAFALLHQGDSASFILNAKDFFTKTAQYPTVPEGIDSTTMITFDVKVLKIESLEQIQKAADERALKLKNEEGGKLQNFISSKEITTVPTSSGVYVIEQKPGSGRLIQKGDMVKVDFTVLTIDEQKVFSTLDRQQPITFEYGQPFDTKGFDEAIGMMKKGSSARVIVPSAMAFGEKGRRDMGGNDIIPPYTTVIYDIEVLDIKTKAQHEKEQAEKEAKSKAEAKAAEAKESGLIQKYLKDNNISVKPTASGLYYVEKVRGKGSKAMPGKKVSVHYTGRLVDGTVFDSSLERKPAQPFEFTLGAGQVIPGWDEGIALMNEGGKAILVIPSKLGYGSGGSGATIKPFSPLVFDVELVKVNK